MRFAVLALALVLAAASPGRAADPKANSESRPLPDMVVTATAEPASSREVPVFVQVIDRARIDATGAQTLDELLARETPGTVVKYPGAYTSFRLRGFDTYASPGANMDAKSLVLVDGNPLGSGNLSLIPLGIVDRVEVMRGPGSVLYGASAMGGVVNVITRRGKGTPSGNLEAEYGSFNRFQPRASVQGGTESGALGFAAAGRYTTAQSYDAGGGWKYRNTGYNDGAASLTATITPAEGHAVHLFGNYFDAWDVGDPGPTYAQTPGARVRDVMKNLAATYNGKAPDLDVDWRLAAWAGRHDYINTNTPYYAKSEFITSLAGVDGRVTVPTFSVGRFTVGGRWQTIQEERDGDGVYAPNSRYDNWSVYGEEKVDAGPFSFVGGLRYDRYNLGVFSNDVLTSVASQNRVMDRLSWRLGANWRALDQLTFRASAGSAFTPPDAYKFSGRYRNMGANYIGNPNLKPESGVTFEGGADFEWQGLAFSATVFHTATQDAVTTSSTTVNGASGWQTWVNSDGRLLTGVEGFVRYAKDFAVGSHTLTVTPSLNWIWYLQRTEQDSVLTRARGTDTVLGLSQYSVTPGLQLAWNSLIRLDLTAEWQGPQKNFDWNPSSSAYGRVVDKSPFLVAGAKLSVRPVEHLETYILVNNIGDERYSYVDGYPMPGRTVAAGLRWEF